ncbi:MAG: hypothetical protein J2P22_04060 [Nocardioides sp.]|nr:hypothetical protein [Nocardioides sp.]
MTIFDRPLTEDETDLCLEVILRSAVEVSGSSYESICALYSLLFSTEAALVDVTAEHVVLRAPDILPRLSTRIPRDLLAWACLYAKPEQRVAYVLDQLRADPTPTSDHHEENR